MTLSDGRHGVRAQLQVEAREPARDKIENQNSTIQNSTPPAVLDFIASDDTLDRYGEVLDPGGWRLDNYRRNPVFQNAHQYGDIIFTLGRALLTEVRNVPGPDGRTRLALYQRVEFAVEANPVARIAYALYKGKFLNAVSVGFIPLRWEDAEGEAGHADAGPPRAPRCRRRYLEQELLEVSAVGIPANPAALQLGLRAGAVAKSELEHVLELLRALFDSKLKIQSSGSEVQGSEFQAGSAILHPPSSIFHPRFARRSALGPQCSSLSQRHGGRRNQHQRFGCGRRRSAVAAAGPRAQGTAEARLTSKPNNQRKNPSHEHPQ